ncbi:GTP-binding protein Era [Bacteroidales bacterium 6E]|nr:GTP-binding protein Era [Bacteroidales bacterium 6E]
MQHRSGFVNIIGNPNVGKSTIMNALVGERLSIITSKMQTTRHRIKGIVNGEDFQIVYSDTPGILKPNYKLQETMMRFVDTALIDADIILYITDVVEDPSKNQEYIEKIRKSNVPVIVLINKIDLSNQEAVIKLYEYWTGTFPGSAIFPVSATEKFNLQPVFDRILELLPENPPFFPKDELTDRSERFFMQEIIREKILLNYQKEIPYSTEVEVEEFKEEDQLIRIRAIIFVERDSQKGIIIGKGGTMLKKVGTLARQEAEEFFSKKIFLELYVKVAKEWREKDSTLRKFGYFADEA